MSDPDDEVFGRFARRFAGVDEFIPEPPPMDSRRSPVHSRVTSTAHSSFPLVGIVLLILGFGFVEYSGAGRPSPSPVPTNQPSEVGSASQPVGSPTAQPGSPTPEAVIWKVDIINGPHSVIVELSNDLGNYRWLIAANEQVTLVDRPAVLYPTQVTVYGAAATDDPCIDLATISVPAESFTIILSGAATGHPYEATIRAGATLEAPVRSPRTGLGCFG